MPESNSPTWAKRPAASAQAPGKAEPRWTATPTARDLAISFIVAVILGALTAGVILAVAAGPRAALQSASDAAANALQTPATLPGQAPATPVAAESPTEYKAITRGVQISDIASAPNTYLGVSVNFTGVVTGFYHDSTGEVAGIDVMDPHNASAIIQVNYTPYVTADKIKVGDSVTIWGQGTGSIFSVKGAGTTAAEGAVNEIYLHDATSGYDDNGVTDPLAYINGGG